MTNARIERIMPDQRISFQPHKQLKCWFLQGKMFCQVSRFLFLFSSVSLLKFRAGSKGLLVFASRLARFVSLPDTRSWVRMASHRNRHKINSLKCWRNSQGNVNPTFSLSVLNSEEGCLFSVKNGNLLTSRHFHSRSTY